MSNFEAKHQRPNPNKLKPLPRLMLALVVAALGACQKPSPPITAPVPGTETVLTFMPTNNGVRAYEFRADQPNKMMTGLNVGDVFNAYEAVNDTNLPPQQAAGCADDIVGANLQNLQPVPADSQGPSSAREVLAPEGGLIIPIDSCGNLKNNSTPTASPSPEQTQTSAPIATLQTPIKKALINNENIVAVLGTLCGSILGIGAMLGGLMARPGRKEKKPKENKPKSNTQVVLTRIDGGDESKVPAVILLQGNDNIPGMVMFDGKLQSVLRNTVAIVMETDAATLKEARRLLTNKLIKGKAPARNRAEIASLAAHEADHIETSPGGVSMLEIVKTPSGMIIGASVTPLKPDPTTDEIRTMASAPGEDQMSKQDRYLHDHAEQLAREKKKK